MDEPGTYRPTAVRVQEQPPDEILGLLCSWNGRIRNHQREPAIPQIHRPNCYHEGIGRQTPPSRGGVHEESVGDVGAMLDASTERSSEHRKCPSVFRDGLKFVGIAFHWSG